MFKKILVPTDGTLLSEMVIAGAIRFANINPGCQIFGLSVIVPISHSPFHGFSANYLHEHEKHIDDHANRHVGVLKTAVVAAGIPCEVLVTKATSPADEIVRVAQAYQCDCIFMASHGRKGLNKLFLGSETQKVLAQADFPVMVYR